ncbi:MAG: crossover junction endodeoxyribonuclease RuvC [Pseudomonadota bacterium]
MLIALDIAFKNIGWTLWENKHPIMAGVIQTEKTQNKQTRVCDDNAYRCSVAARTLHEIIRRHSVKAIIGESPMGSQSAAAAKSAGLAIGLVATTACLLDLPIEFCTPDAVKKAVTGRKDASKDDIMDRVIELYGGSKTVKTIPVIRGKRAGKESERVDYHFLGGVWPKRTFEHIADSYGAYLALQDNNLVRMFGEKN